MHYERSGFLWIGIALVVTGFFITLWQSIFIARDGFKGFPVLALFLIPTSFIGIGFSIVAHHFWKQYKEHSKTFRRKKGFEP